MSKSIFVSKTFWLNGLGLAYGIAAYFHGPVPTADPEVIAMIASVLNLGLRLVTKQPVTVTQ